jgi:hypothetical protein
MFPNGNVLRRLTRLTYAKMRRFAAENFFEIIDFENPAHPPPPLNESSLPTPTIRMITWRYMIKIVIL